MANIPNNPQEKILTLMKELSTFFQVEGTYSSIKQGAFTVVTNRENVVISCHFSYPGMVFDSGMRFSEESNTGQFSITAGVNAGADHWREIEQPKEARGVMGVYITFGAGIEAAEYKTQWKNGLPFWPVIASGKFAGKVWQAGQAGAIFCIAYPGELSELWEIPGGIIGIIEQVHRAGKQVEIDLKTKPETYVNFEPFKSLAMIAATDKSAEITRHMRRKSSGAKVEENPFLVANWQKSTAAVFFAGKATEAAQNIQSPEDLRGFIATAFEGESFAILLTLCWFHDKIKRDKFDIRISDICKAIWGAKYKAGIPEMVWQTINALHHTTIKLTQPEGKKLATYWFTPVTIIKDVRTEGKEYPTKIRIEIFSQLEGKPFKKLMIPGNIESLKPSDFKLLTYLLARQNQYPGKADKIALNETEVMRAAGLEKTHKTNPSKARTDITNKINRLNGAGCIGELIKIRDGAVYLKYEGQKRALNQRKGKSG